MKLHHGLLLWLYVEKQLTDQRCHRPRLHPEGQWSHNRTHRVLGSSVHWSPFLRTSNLNRKHTHTHRQTVSTKSDFMTSHKTYIVDSRPSSLSRSACSRWSLSHGSQSCIQLYGDVSQWETFVTCKQVSNGWLVLTFFAGCEETHNGWVDVSSCCRVTRSHRVDLWQYALVVHDGTDWSLECQI